jgi:hypothetical protein
MAQSNEPVKTPAQIRLTDHNFNRENSFGNRVQRLLYFGGSRFRLDEEKLKKSSIEHEWIMKASDQAWSVEHKGGNLNLEPPTGQEKYLDKPELAMLLKGKFASTWKDKKVPYFMKEVDKTDETPAPPQRPGQPPAKPQMVPDSTTAEENQIVGEIHDSKVLLIGSSTIFKDDFMGDQNHQAFFLNCVDALTLGDDLIHIRAKATLDATLPLTTDSEKSFWKFFVIAFMPLVFGVIGMIIIVTGNVRANG